MIPFYHLTHTIVWTLNGGERNVGFPQRKLANHCCISGNNDCIPSVAKFVITLTTIGSHTDFRASTLNSLGVYAIYTS